MKYIIGLGNPGEKYKNTRHNIAWLIFDAMNLSDWRQDKYMNAEFTGDKVSGDLVLYIKPQTFMNRSGEVIASLKKQDNFSSGDVILLYDDVDLEFGKVRVSYNRGDGGHNGVKSITNHIRTKKTIRIRVGVSRKIEEGRLIKPNVLSSFSSGELSFIKDKLTPRVEEIVRSLILNGVERTMNIYNSR